MLEYKAHINTYNRSEAFQIIEDNMPVNSSDLSNSPLWPIFQIGDSLKFSAQLVHIMLCHEIITDKKHEMWFKVGSKIARFSIVEFAAITGLNCKDFFEVDVPNVSSRSELNITSLNFDILADIMGKESDLKKKIRWANVLLVDSVLLPRRRNSEIDATIYALSSNMDSFSKYPWGRACYNEFIASLMQFNRSHHDIVSDRFGYNVNGYPLAFQVSVVNIIIFTFCVYVVCLCFVIFISRCGSWKLSFTSLI